MTDSLNLPRGFYHLHLPTTDSTMLCLLRPDLAARSEEFVLVTTDFQTAGHGQRGTVWEAAAGRNLLFSFAFHPTFVSAGGQFRLSEALALAVAESLDVLPAEVSVKWPNDIYAGDRKICGMLLEHDLRGTHIYNTRAGVGLNVNQQRFEGDAPNPVSMRQLLGRDTERGPLLSAILHRFCAYYRLLRDGGAATVDERYAARLYRREGLHPFSDAAGPFSACIHAVRPDGRLVLRDATGRLRTYAFKEVRFEPEEENHG